MALTPVGFDGSIDERQWSRMLRYVGEIAYKHGVASGFDVTAGSGSGRPVVVSAGTALLPGVLVDNPDAATTLNHDPNSGTANRSDYVVLRGDWTANTATLAIVKGTSSSPPALTQTEGSVWEMPLARVRVRPTVSTLLSTDIFPCKPLPRTQTIVYRPTVGTASISPAHAATIISTANVVDPGWPYRVRFSGAVSFAAAASGLGRIIVQADSTVVGRGESWLLSGSGGNATAQVFGVTDVLSGPVAMTLSVVADNMGAGDGPLATGAQTGLHSFSAEVVPA